MTSTLAERDRPFDPAELKGKTIMPPSAMNFQYSDVVDPLTYKTEGLCEGIAL